MTTSGSSDQQSEAERDGTSVAIKREMIANATKDTTDSPVSPTEVIDIAEESDPAAEASNPVGEDGDEVDALGDSSGLRQAYIDFYMEEMQALWKERSSSLEMVQAIQRSLLISTAQIPAVEETQSPAETELCAESTKPEDVEMKTEDAEEKSEEEAKKLEQETTGKAVESGPVTALTSELVVKAEPEEEEVHGKFQREKELREEIETCLAQWQRIQWPEELNSTFLSPTSVHSEGGALAIKNEHIKSQPTTAADEADTKLKTPVDVMSELKRVMIDLTHDQVVPPPKPVEPTTLVMYHPVFINHQTPKNHPECPERMNRVVNMLNTLAKKHLETLKIDRLSTSPEELCPPETTLLMVHSPTYLRQLKERALEAGAQVSSPSARPSSPSSRALVFESDSGIRDEPTTPGKASSNLEDGRPPLSGAFGAASLEQNGVELDTFVSSKSWDVARAAAGTVCLAVDCVVRKEFHNAVCLVRPPGHHVGRHGRTEGAPSSGFCLLNNVVIGATHARLYPWIRKVAVLDWDIHHGNGTEELLKDDPDAFFASIHLYSSGKYFPGTGKSCQTGNLINVALENTGAGSGSQAFRSALETTVLPAMRAFRPDVIFISAGFDGHRDDILGGVAAVRDPNVPAGYVEEDYAWATQEVLKLAAEVCDGRVVSVLEGGYDVRKETNSLAKSVAAHVSAISAYELELRQTAPSSRDKSSAGGGDGQAEMKEEETTTTSKTDVVKSETVKKEPAAGGLLDRLLATDLTDDSVVIVDDDEEMVEAPAGTQQQHEEDDGDVVMADAEPSSRV